MNDGERIMRGTVLSWEGREWTAVEDQRDDGKLYIARPAPDPRVTLIDPKGTSLSPPATITRAARVVVEEELGILVGGTDPVDWLPSPLDQMKLESFVRLAIERGVKRRPEIVACQAALALGLLSTGHPHITVVEAAAAHQDLDDRVPGSDVAVLVDVPAIDYGELTELSQFENGRVVSTGAEAAKALTAAMHEADASEEAYADAESFADDSNVRALAIEAVLPDDEARRILKVVWSIPWLRIYLDRSGQAPLEGDAS